MSEPQIAKADYYFDDADRSKLSLSGEHLLVSKGGQVFEAVVEAYGFVDGVPAGVTLPAEANSESPDVEMPTPQRFDFPPGYFEGHDDADR